MIGFPTWQSPRTAWRPTVSTNRATPPRGSVGLSASSWQEEKGNTARATAKSPLALAVSCRGPGCVSAVALLSVRGWLLPSGSQAPKQTQLAASLIGWLDFLCGPALQSMETQAQTHAVRRKRSEVVCREDEPPSWPSRRELALGAVTHPARCGVKHPTQRGSVTSASQGGPWGSLCQLQQIKARFKATPAMCR